MEGNNIPKFASFLPKPPPKREQSPAPSQDSIRRRRHHEQTKPTKELERAHANSDGSRRRRRPSTDESRHWPGESRINQPRAPARSESNTNEPNIDYIVDKRGDRDNLTYGSLDRNKIPLYRRYGAGHMIGLPANMRINRTLTSDREIVLNPEQKPKQERLFARNPGKKYDSSPTQLVKGMPSTSEVQLNYIPIREGRKRKRRHGSEDEESGSDASDRFEGSNDTVPANPEIVQKNRLLENRIRDHPQDLQAWLDLVEHQGSMLLLDRSVSLEDLSTSDQRALAETRMSIYERALRHIGANRQSKIRLSIGLMNEATRCRDPDKVATKWEALIAEFPESPDIWMKYLDFIQTNFKDFTYESCKTSFRKALVALRQHSSTDPGLIPYLILRMTTFIKEAGYQEQAIAIWQAILEFHVIGHASGTISEFEEFWESEVARVGEFGAKGWRHWNAEQSPPLSLTPDTNGFTTNSKFESFHLKEVDRMARMKLPGRTVDDVGDEDPYHVVLFSDINEWLLFLPKTLSGTDIVQSFLCFYHLPPLPSPTPANRSWWLDPFVGVARLDPRKDHNRNPSAHEAHSRSILQTLEEFNACPLNNFEMTTDLLFDQAFKEDLDPIDTDFIHWTLKLLVNVLKDDAIAIYLMAYELRFFPTEVTKTSRLLLKSQSSNLVLYNAYGLVESRQGNSEKADHIFGTALKMAKDTDSFTEAGRLDLFESWIWEALRRLDLGEALRRLASPQGKSATGNEAPDAAAILRAKSLLQSHLDQYLAMRNYRKSVTASSLLSLLAYLTPKLSLSTAIGTHECLTSYFTARQLSSSPYAEIHAQCLVRLLTLHIRLNKSYKPFVLRSILEAPISLFPENTILLALHAANEARFRLDDRVRGLAAEMFAEGRKDRSVVRWLWEAWYEMKRAEHGGGTAESVRSVIMKAYKHIGKGARGIWLLAVLFEVQQLQILSRKHGASKVANSNVSVLMRRDYKRERTEVELLEKQRERLKQVFFLGLRNFPWWKEFVMLAFGDLKDVLSREEMNQCWGVLLEKGLRVYAELNE